MKFYESINQVLVSILMVSAILSISQSDTDSSKDLINYGAMVERNYGTINLGKGNNYIEENRSQSSSIETISINYENYNIELKGKVKVSNEFKPFRINIRNEDPSDPSERVYKKTLNIKNPFYTIDAKLINENDYEKKSHAIYDRCIDEECSNEINGYIYLIEITNITDFGEDIIISNKVSSYINRKGDAYRVISAFGTGGAGEYIKLNKNIPLKEGTLKFKFKNADYVSLKHGETIILAIPYIAKKSGVYLPSLTLDIKYAGAKGKLKINLPELIVPKLIGWVDYVGSPIKSFTDMNTVRENNNYGVKWTLFEEVTQQMKRFTFSERKLSKDDLRFIGKDYCKIFRNELFALKGAKFKSKWLEEYFKERYPNKYKPKVAAHKILKSQFTDIELYNIKLALEVEKELSK